MRTKHKRILAALAAGLCLGAVLGGAALFDRLYPLAGPIQVPEADEVLSASLVCSEGGKSTPLAAGEVEALLAAAQPTRGQALEDVPTQEPWYGLDLRTQEREYRYFFCEKYGRFYLEVPYEGLYETEGAVWEAVTARRAD